tara:strand:+ start:156 stop:383 length:228 start_codon:yes stop_codon:yes gene_type:complete
MKLYAVNYYVGGTPMEGKTLGVFDSLDKAKESLLQNLKELEIPEECIDTQDDFYVFWDMDDFWGGIEIQKLTLNN